MPVNNEEIKEESCEYLLESNDKLLEFEDGIQPEDDVATNEVGEDLNPFLFFLSENDDKPDKNETSETDNEDEKDDTSFSFNTNPGANNKDGSMEEKSYSIKPGQDSSVSGSVKPFHSVETTRFTR